ncbi:MAG TPA: hypothetical protein VJL59_14400, partial [Anaerolineales bacterium]|nr:hypothetical protein [Anaerolineales bacterium]
SRARAYFTRQEYGMDGLDALWCGPHLGSTSAPVGTSGDSELTGHAAVRCIAAIKESCWH